MNILVLNGSPKGEKSNTFKITTAFLDGLNVNKDNTIDSVTISKMAINHCIGCFACWTKTPGKCVLTDDMSDLIDKYLAADLIIWSFPLYYFGMPSKAKAFLDRMLPTNLPFMAERPDGGSGHPSRYDMTSKKYILISTCGFYSAQNNYDALLRQFEIMYGDHLTKIICTEGELFSVPQLEGRTSEYLFSVNVAGLEYANTGALTQVTQDKLSELLYPPEVFVEMADASWEINEPLNSSQVADKSHNFMRQMAAICNPSVSNGKDIVLEMYFTDLDKIYQFEIKENKCTLLTEDLKAYTTRIETSFELWLKISEGKENGAEAMMQRKYKVLGDFDIMLKMDELFGSKKPTLQTDIKKKKTNMNLLLLPWLALWVLFPINMRIGGAISVISCAIVFLLASKIKTTKYERISSVIISILGVAALMDFSSVVVLTCLSYVLFGAMWFISAFEKIPLTAYYSCNDYDGETAFDNPLFIKTNRILTLLWGVFYFIVSVCTYFLMKSNIASFTGLINSIGPAIMGIFTIWFAKWYPAKVARG